jgi:ABC-type uncharacterized transport system substrate-binding protein
MRVQACLAGCIGALAVFLSIAAATPVSAHPHVWVTVETEVLHDPHGVIGFRHHWTFDEFYTSFALQGLDKNNDGQYDAEELKELAEVNITSLKEFGFFTFPQLGRHEVARLEPRDYSLEHQNNVLTLHFTLPLKEPVSKAKLKDFHFAIYDPTFYVSFGFAEKDPIRIAAGLGDCRAEISKPEVQAPAKSLSESVTSTNDQLMGAGQQYAQTVRVKCGAAS